MPDAIFLIYTRDYKKTKGKFLSDVNLFDFYRCATLNCKTAALLAAAPPLRSGLLPPDQARHFPLEGKNREFGTDVF